jgi:uncharacterized protein (TIGR02284 family)
MIGFNLFRTPPFILEKINLLCRLLWQGKKEYEHVAANIGDKEFKRTILTLAQENNQYACELSSTVQSLGGVPPKENNYEPEPESEINNFKDQSVIMAFCKMNEKKMVSAYREILNEPSLYEGLRKMIQYQLNGILCAFMQLKLLSSLKIHYTNFAPINLAHANNQQGFSVSTI